MNQITIHSETEQQSSELRKSSSEILQQIIATRMVEKLGQRIYFVFAKRNV